MRSKSILHTKNFAFPVRIIKLSVFLAKERSEFVLSKQIIRSGTAIGALVRESEHPESIKDFIHKLTISLKETNECIYWLELLYTTGFITKRMFDSLMKDGTEILRLLISSVKTLKSK